MQTAMTESAPQLDALDQDENVKRAKKKLANEFRKRIEASKQYRRKLIQNWQLNVDYRRGKPFASQDDKDRVSVPLDWSLTEMKQSLLFSQVPAVRVNHPPETLSKEISPWLNKFETRINDTLIAAGIGIVMISYEAITEMVEVPAIDLEMMPPELQAQILQTGVLPNGQPVPMEQIPRVLDKRYVIGRISPANFLWPVSFTGSNFDKSPWIGHTGQVTWAVAQQRWQLDPKNKNKYLGTETNAVQDAISNDVDKAGENGDEFVEFDEIFFHDQQYSANAKKYASIHHMVFINGQDMPVVDETWRGQEPNPETGDVIGAQRYPIRVLTLT